MLKQDSHSSTVENLKQHSNSLKSREEALLDEYEEKLKEITEIYKHHLFDLRRELEEEEGRERKDWSDQLNELQRDYYDSVI